MKALALIFRAEHLQDRKGNTEGVCVCVLSTEKQERLSLLKSTTGWIIWGKRPWHYEEILTCKEHIDMQKSILFSSSCLEFHVPGRTDDLYYHRTAHIHKSWQNCLKGNPQFYINLDMSFFFNALTKECFIITLTSLGITQILLSHKEKKAPPIIYIKQTYFLPSGIKTHYPTTLFPFVDFIFLPAILPFLSVCLWRQTYIQLQFVSC